ncbi:MAG: hypothetical protein V3R87_13090 [Dehalococcoidia bacterium]
MMRRFALLTVTASVPAPVICPPAPESTQAYLYPGTGGQILQAGIAAFVGGLFAAKIFRSGIHAFCRRLLIWV